MFSAFHVAADRVTKHLFSSNVFISSILSAFFHLSSFGSSF